MSHAAFILGESGGIRILARKVDARQPLRASNQPTIACRCCIGSGRNELSGFVFIVVMNRNDSKAAWLKVNHATLFPMIEIVAGPLFHT